MTEKKKNEQSPNMLAFILFWVVVVGLTQAQALDYSEFWRAANDIIMRLPQFLHRLWLVYVLHGFAAGLAIGLAQNFALQSLRPMRLKYWIPASIVMAVIAKVIDYSMMRWVYSPMINPIPFPTEVYLIAPYASQLLLLLVPWWFLRKQFKHAWLWLLLAIPNLALASSMTLYSFIPYLQALIAACVLVWLNHQTPMHGKLRASAETEGRLYDSLPEEEDEIEEEEAPAYFHSKS